MSPAQNAGRSGATAGGTSAVAGKAAPQAGGGSVARGGAGGSAGRGNVGGATGANGAAGRASAGASAGGAPAGGASAGGAPADTSNLPKFSFFVTSLEAMRRLSKSQDGFGGDLRYGEADGLSGADKICTEIAEAALPGSGSKGWRAFLSANKGPSGSPVAAIERVGNGPWYDRMGRLLAMSPADLLAARPKGADAAIANDLPNELGVGNHNPDGQGEVDNHHVLTGSDAEGKPYSATGTCNDWTSTDPTSGRPRIGFSWPARGREHWISGQDEGGCGAGIELVDMGGSTPKNPVVGSGGGYGAIYCFALKP